MVMKNITDATKAETRMKVMGAKASVAAAGAPCLCPGAGTLSDRKIAEKRHPPADIGKRSAEKQKNDATHLHRRALPTDEAVARGAAEIIADHGDGQGLDAGNRNAKPYPAEQKHRKAGGEIAGCASNPEQQQGGHQQTTAPPTVAKPTGDGGK
jgi:hypothetical protein